MSELQEIRDKVDYFKSLCSVKSSDENFEAIFELIIRLTKELEREKQNRLDGELS